MDSKMPDLSQVKREAVEIKDHIEEMYQHPTEEGYETRDFHHGFQQIQSETELCEDKINYMKSDFFNLKEEPTDIKVEMSTEEYYSTREELECNENEYCVDDNGSDYGFQQQIIKHSALKKKKKMGTAKEDCIIYEHSYKKIEDFYICIKCTDSKKFPNRQKVIYHIASEHYGIKYKCTQCNKDYRNKNGLKYHLKAQHQINIQNIKTRDVIKIVPENERTPEVIFYNPDTINIAIRKRVNRFSFDKSYKKIKDYYICLECTNSDKFGDRNLITRHLREEHYGIKYTCPQCQKEYKHKDTLRRHLKKKHQIDIWNLKADDFIQQPYNKYNNSYSQSYAKIGDDYICIVCTKSKKFSHRESILRHIRNEHYGIRYACTECAKEYKDRSCLKEHLMEKHKIDISKLQELDIIKKIVAPEIQEVEATFSDENTDEDEAWDIFVKEEPKEY